MPNKNLLSLLETPAPSGIKFSDVNKIPVPETIDKSKYKSLMSEYSNINANGTKNQLFYGNSLFRKFTDYLLRKVDNLFNTNIRSGKIEKAAKRQETCGKVSNELISFLRPFAINFSFYKQAYLGSKQARDQILQDLSNLELDVQAMKSQYNGIFNSRPLDAFEKEGDVGKRNYVAISQYLSSNQELLDSLTEGKSEEQKQEIISNLKDPDRLYLFDIDASSKINLVKHNVKLQRKHLKNNKAQIARAKKNLLSASKKVDAIHKARLDLEFSKQVYAMYVQTGSRNVFG